MGELLTDEVQLVSLAQRGDRPALGVLIGRHRAMALAVCRRVLHDQALAEDAVQEASLLALLHIARLRKPDRFGAWLAGIALNVCRTWLREQAAESWSWEALLGGQRLRVRPDWGIDPQDVAIEADLARRIQNAVAKLPPSQREAVTLFYIAGLSYQEVMVALGIRLGAVKTRLNKARAALRLQMLDELEEVVMPTSAATEPITMRVVDVRRARTTGEQKPAFVVLLEEVDGGRRLPIWIGPHEATAIALHLENVELPRPHAYMFLANMMRAAGLRLIEARITRLDGDVFYAVAKIAAEGGRTNEVDARPSDVINLALLTGCPLLIEPSILSLGADRLGTRELLTEANSDGADVIAAETKEAWPTRPPK